MAEKVSIRTLFLDKEKTMALYKRFIRPALFSLDSESIHEIMLGLLELGVVFPLLRSGLSSVYNVSDERLKLKVAGIEFNNPVGLAAGFDKSAKAVPLLSSFGFGSIEVGTITAEAQEGNPRPRIHRFPEDNALINSMGFPSDGAERARKRLQELVKRKNLPVLGINIGKTKNVPLEKSIEDYLQTFSLLKDFGDYFVINVSSPNTPELRKLQEPERLSALIKAVQQQNMSGKPLFIKISPDLSFRELEDVLEVCDDAEVAGVIAVNTTFSREGISKETDLPGGLSGAPLFKKSLEMVQTIRREMVPEFAIIGVGGIFNSDDAIAMLKAGANLLQVYTSFIYEGPGVVQAINRGLCEHMDKAGISSVSELTGTGENG